MSGLDISFIIFLLSLSLSFRSLRLLTTAVKGHAACSGEVMLCEAGAVNGLLG